jgi:hypothetical protein
MANPGPASSQTPVQLFNGDAADGIIIGGSATKLVGFHGVAATAQAAAITDIADDASGAAIATAVNALIAALADKGLIATA